METINQMETLKMGENNCKWSNWQRINLQNIQAAHETQYQRNEQQIKKWLEDLNSYFFKEDIQMINKHMEDAQHCSLLEKWKSKLQWGITSHWSEWPWSKNYKQ